MDQGHARPVSALAKRYKVPRGQVRDYIARARKLGLLSLAVHQGQKGGTLTPKGEAILSQRERRSR